MNSFVTPDTTLAVFALAVVMVPAVTSSLYYLRQLRSPAPGNESIRRSEYDLRHTQMEREVSWIAERVRALEQQHASLDEKFSVRIEDLFQVLSQLRVEIARLATLMEKREEQQL